MKKSMEIFKKFLRDTIGIYGTLPDDGSYHCRLEIEFRMANEAFEKLKVDSLREMVIYELQRNRKQLDEYIDKKIKEIRNYPNIALPVKEKERDET